MKIPYYNQCVKYALQKKGIEGDSFKDTTLRVFKREATNPKTLVSILKKDGMIIPTVKASLFGNADNEFVSTVVISMDSISNMVRLYVPEADEERVFSFVDFCQAWSESNYACTTAFPSDSHTYYPKLIDLQNISLPSGYEELREAIAENAHNMWAQERQSEGWSYGPKRDDAKLETPDMVPYSELPDSERQYDRVMAADTLKLLIALGYRIEKD